MITINPNYLKLQGSYLFAEVARHVKEYQAAHPGQRIIKLGIGDVTRPLTPSVISSLHAGVNDMAAAETFQGYGPYEGFAFLREKIAECDYRARGVNVSPDEIFISTGAKEDTANIQELFAQDATIAITDPVYPVYIDSNVMAGRTGAFADGRFEKVVYLDSTAENDFLPEPPDKPVDLIYLCFPNNPTGQCTKHSLLTAILERCRECSALLVLDECFLEFLPDRKERTLLPYLGQYPNLVILRAFTKLYAMAGVRLGYCVCSDAKRKEQLMESGQPWGVSLLAQEAGVAALSEQAYADRVRKLVEQQRPILVKGLRQAGFTVWEGKANYLLFRSHDATLGKRMEEAGFPMRDCSNYHNLQPGDYRIAVRTEEENRGFLEALFLCQGKKQL